MVSLSVYIATIGGGNGRATAGETRPPPAMAAILEGAQGSAPEIGERARGAHAVGHAAHSERAQRASVPLLGGVGGGNKQRQP